MSDQPIYRLVEQLPQSGVTPMFLNALDYLAPGAWENTTNFEAMIRAVSGEDDQDLIQRIGERAIALYEDPEQGYQRAVWIFQAVDSVDKIAGASALANKLGEKISFLSFLDRVTPEADTAQAVDAAVKLAAELGAFCYTNGIPGDSVGDFVQSLWSYEKEDVIRVAAYLSVDCLIPLGPDFIAKISDAMNSVSESELLNHGLFAKVSGLLPGSVGEQKELLQRNFQEASGFLQGFVDNHGMTQESMLERVRSFVDIADDKLDYVAAALDMTTNYFEHTGIQTVSRRLISRAYGEI